MEKVHRRLVDTPCALWCLIGLLSLFIVVDGRAQGVEVAARPSFSVLLLESQLNRDVVARWQAFELKQSYLAERAEIDVFETVSLNRVSIDQDRFFVEEDGSKQVSATYFPSGVDEVIRSYPLDRHIINHLFMVDASFKWSLDRLMQRAMYAQTTAEASVQVTSTRGGLNMAADRALENVMRVYTVVLMPDVYEKDVTVKKNGKEVTERRLFTDGYHVALLKLDLNTVDEARKALSPYFCGEDCADAEARRSAYENANFGFDPLWSGTVSSTKDGTEHFQDVIKKVMDKAVLTIPDLQYEAFVLNDRPIQSRIGKKEGVRVGRRYEVVRQFEENGDRIRKRRGYVRAKSVTDNRGRAIRRTASGKEEVVAYEPSIFKQVHGRNIEPMDILVERPDLGLNLQAGYRAGAYDAFGVDMYYRLPGTFATLGGLTGELFTEDSDLIAQALNDEDLSNWLTIRGGLSVAQEYMAMRGFVRLLPFISGSIQRSIPSKTNDDVEDISISAFSYRAGLNATLQFSFKFGVFGGVSYQDIFNAEYQDSNGETTEITWSDFFENGSGIQFEGGIRFNL